MAEYEVRVLLAQLDYSIKEGDIKNWRKREGDPVECNELLFDFETSKISFEVTSPISGFLKQILKGDDETISTKRWEEDQRYTNRIVAIIETDDDIGVAEHSTEIDAPVAAAPDQTPVPEVKSIPPMSPQVRISAERMAQALGMTFDDLIESFNAQFPDTRVTQRRLDELLEILKTKPATEQLVEMQSESPTPHARSSPGVVPAARAKVQELGIPEAELSKIVGTGPDGCVMPEDVESYLLTQGHEPITDDNATSESA